MPLRRIGRVTSVGKKGKPSKPIFVIKKPPAKPDSATAQAERLVKTMDLCLQACIQPGDDLGERLAPLILQKICAVAKEWISGARSNNNPYNIVLLIDLWLVTTYVYYKFGGEPQLLPDGDWDTLTKHLRENYEIVKRTHPHSPWIVDEDMLGAGAFKLDSLPPMLDDVICLMQERSVAPRTDTRRSLRAALRLPSPGNVGTAPRKRFVLALKGARSQGAQAR